MASLLTHPVLPAALGIALGNRHIPISALFFGVLLSVVPDADVVAFKFGIPYGDMLGHRGLSHSLLFAAVMALCLCALPRFSNQRGRIFLFLFLSAASHGLLDAMTTGGMGVGFFIPFSGDRYFLPVRPIRVSPLSVKGFFTGRGWLIFQSELLWVWLPCTLAALVGIFWRRRAKARA